MFLTDATASLRKLLQSALHGDETVFAGSLHHWTTQAADRPGGIGVFLHQIEERAGGMAGEWQDVRDSGGRVVARRGPARRFQLSYILWAWSPHSPDDESDLLSRAMTLLAAHYHLPPWCLEGTLASGAATRLTLAPEGGAASGHLWSAAQVPWRTTLHLAMTAELAPAEPAAIARNVEELRLHTSTTPEPRRS
ncbi:Pvc16 family protein [Streptomyces wuyuanensis]|uniref:Pvc16 family protein n=1 Tax=Streptomyces wuyuanensis TaxID=1196353 RepID=UPI0034331A99